MLRREFAEANPFAKYVNDPVGFAEHVLGIDCLTDEQKRALNLLLEAPWRVMCPAANEVGKTFIAAVAVLWWYCTRSPAIVITTAPTFKQVKDLLWKEVRRLARRSKIPLNLPFLPKDCRIERAPDDFATGVTANDATSFLGHHGPNILFVIDEAVGVDPEFFEAIETMFSPPGHAVFAIYNPTDTTSYIYREYLSAMKRRHERTWHVVRIAADDHPNIAAELRGEPAPIPHAIRLGSFERRLLAWAQLLVGDPKPTDVEWPPRWATEYVKPDGTPGPYFGRTDQHFRPGPIAEARILGRFPSQTVYSVWSDGDWMSACRELSGQEPLPIPLQTLPEIGCDVARFGDDWTAFHVRCGPVSLHHERFNGQDTVVTRKRLKELAKEFALWANDRRPDQIDEFAIPIKVDDSGVGGGVTDDLRADQYNVIGINAGCTAIASEDYKLRRDELWFTVAERARWGDLDLSRLPEDIRDRLRSQAMTPKYKLDGAGRRIVDPKDVTKKESGASQDWSSPDDCDAMNLAYASAEGDEIGEAPSIGMIRGQGLNPVQERLRQLGRGR